MKRFRSIFIIVAILALSFSYAEAQVKFRGFTALNGGGTGAVDKIPIAELVNGDIGFVATTTNFYVFKFDSTSTDAEACADPICTRIRPDDYSTAGVWELVNLYGAAIVTGPSADPTITLSDSDNAAGTAKVFGNSSGGANDIIMSIGVEDSTGESTVYVEVDGVSETVDVLKPLVVNATGVKLTGSNGSLTILGLGDGQDEDVKIDLNTTENTITISSPASSATAMSFSALNMVTTGTMSGLMPTVVEATATTYNITQAQARAGTFFVNTNAGTKTWVLPAAEAGMAVCVRQGQGVANIMRVDTDGTDYLVSNSTGARTSSAGDYIEWTASAKNQFCAVAFDSTDWYITSETAVGVEQ